MNNLKKAVVEFMVLATAAFIISTCSKPTNVDYIPPAPTFDLAVTVLAPDSLMLTWTATGDDRYTGRAFSYDVRFVDRWVTVANWDSLTPVPCDLIPKLPGSVDTFIIVADSFPSPCSFALRTCDEAGNCSKPSNAVGTIVPSGTLVNFPDPVLNAGIKYWVFSPQGRVYSSELEKLTKLELKHTGPDSTGIRDLTGIEYCSNLQQLIVTGHPLTDISPLSQLTKLVKLDLGHNKITDISPLANMAKLSSLTAWSNAITDISPLAGLSELRIAWLEFNQIGSSTPLRNLEKLEQLGLTLNKMTDVAALVDNKGLGEGDVVFLVGNPLTQESIQVELPALRARGVIVYF